ncbi:MAG TPA: aquaporin [Actinomycetota bacterium]|nr:aquaporin [Actinomycetota bacterium]
MKRYIAEFIAAFFLVFAVSAAIVADQQETVTRLQSTIGTLGIALAYGLALAVVIAAVGRISGAHANPAVSVAFYIAKRLSLKDLGGYVAAQLLGSLVAAVVVRQIFPSERVESVGAGAPGLGEGITLLQGGLIEVMLTFFLVFVIWGVAVDPKGPKILAPLAIGLTVVFDVIVGNSATGAAMNPARWFGPALLGDQLNGNWPVWVLGPIVGALIASTAYELFFLDAEDSEITVEDLDDLEPRAPEILPPTPEESAAEDAAVDESDGSSDKPA